MAIDANVGARVGNYTLVKKLGEGGMAEVWLARHVTSAQLRAIKFLNKQFQGMPEVEARFQTEGESQLIHPNIVRVFEVGQHDGSSYLAMQFIDGRDLEKIMDSRRGPLTVAEALDMGVQILAGLGFAHSSGIVHRDIKPSNVLVDSEGRAFLMDFGIAKALRTGRVLTQVNSRLGTPDYMSPEQIRNPRDVDSRSDIYSFGCLFYELLTGWPPFDRGAGYETEHDIKTAHVTEAPTPPMMRKTGLPPALNEITLRCLAKAKEERPQTCDEIIQYLQNCQAATRAATARPTPVPTPAPAPVQTPPPSQAMPVQQPVFKPGGGFAPDSPSRRETIVTPASPAAPAWPAPGNPATAGTRPVSGPVSGPTYDAGFEPSYAPAGQFQPVQEHPQPYAASSRSATVLDDAARGLKPIVIAETPGQGSSAKPRNTMLIAAASLLLLIAVGGGAWAIFHKPAENNEEASSTKQQAESPASGDSAGSKTSPNAGTTAGSPGKAPSAAQPGKVPGTTPGTVPGVDPANHPAIPIPSGKTNQINPSPETNTPGQVTPQKPVVPPVIQKPTTTMAGSGTLTWTGTIAGNPQVIIVRSSDSASQGQLSGPMFPAAPVKLSVRPAGSAVVFAAPEARTNYNSLQLYVRGVGQQTIYIDWVTQ